MLSLEERIEVTIHSKPLLTYLDFACLNFEPLITCKTGEGLVNGPAIQHTGDVTTPKSVFSALRRKEIWKNLLESE
jgi:hypothetical protein